jgi:SAM-dependent methyltransferase
MKLPIPPVELRKCGNMFHSNDAYYVATGIMEAERLADYHGLGPQASVLDIGCGVGRLAIGIEESPHTCRSYTGVDVDREAIKWAQTHLWQNKKREFQFLDIANERYNPDGALKMDDGFRLPFVKGEFTIIYLYSVFTHLRCPDIKVYLREFKRLLSRNGSVFLTGFFEPRCPPETENPKDYPPRYGDTNMGALHRVRINEGWLFDAVHEAGLDVAKYNHHSEWNYQSAVTLKHAR